MEKRNVPKLRFKGFEDEWKKECFKEVFNKFEYGMNSAAIDFDGENKYIRITDIDDESNKYKSDSLVSPEGNLDEKYLVKCNDILFARTGASVGKSYLYNEEDGKLYFAGFLIRGNVKERYNSKFIFLQTKTSNYEKWVKIMSMRSGQPGINSQEYASYKINNPSLEEQNKIANFLSNVDNIIEEQEGKVKDLEQYKKGMMQKIFKQEVRFRDDNGGEYPEWEEKKLSQITDVLSGKRLPKGETLTTIDTGIKYITVSDMGSKYVSKENIRYITKEIEEQIKKYKVNFGDIIISVAGTLGKINIIDKKISGSNLTENCDKITSFKDCINIYIYYYLNTSLIQNQISSVNTISSQPKLALDRIRKFNVLLPCIEEQTKIANFLSNIDNIIEEENKKLEDLKLWKKGLLQQMFV
ncbi:restriction endonuclease subunit S [Clostridium baratii]|uniref:restriction endonuclease subunit S n=2 Tax=Clostridium baratii TaxID=1561 RepID=UPI0006BB281E|nr:restriction endonuclease subunit S [Clostridium baratii]